jgi:U3 small nucleolar RNA-associated protein 14
MRNVLFYAEQKAKRWARAWGEGSWVWVDQLVFLGAACGFAVCAAQRDTAPNSNLQPTNRHQPKLHKPKQQPTNQLTPTKRLSKIKSKEYHRRTNKAAKRAAKRLLADGGAAPDSGDDAEDAAARRAAAEEAEFERARERLTLKHKNTSRWARRALKRGVDVMDAGTKAALAEQQALGIQLRRKIEGRRSDDDGDDGSSGSGGSTSASDGEAGEAARRDSKSRREALGILKGLSAEGAEAAEEGAAGASKSGLFALPFMRRALEKQRQQAAAEAADLIRELDGGEDGGVSHDDEDDGGMANAGRLRFGGPAAAAAGGGGRPQQRREADEEESQSDDEEDAEAKAERLGRRLRGEAEEDEGAAAAAAGRRKQQAEGGKGGRAALPARGLRRGAQAAATDGPVDVEMNGDGGLLGAAAAANGKGKGARTKAAAATANGGGAALRAASASNAGADAHASLFEKGAKGGRQQQQNGGGQQQQAAGFIPASKFGGAKQGYVFTRGPQGTGYYPDPKSGAAGAAGKGGQQQKGGRGKQQEGVAVAGAAAADSDDQDDDPRRRRQRARAQASAAAAAAQKQQQDGGGDAEHALAAAAAAAAAAGGGSDDDGGAARHMVPLAGDADAQKALLRRAFASDDVAAEFASDKAAEVEEQLPKEEVPGLMPGWGLWADQQREPKWMAEARQKAARRKEAAAAGRKDAKLAHVVISEKWDKRAAKYGTQALPFPYRSADAYENSIRQPLGRDVNPDAAFRNLTRPAVIKSTGVVIDPLRYSKGAAEYGATPAARARGVVTVAGGVQLQGQGPGAGAGPKPVVKAAKKKEAKQ